MVELKNIFIPDDLYYHFLFKFNREKWENLDVPGMKKFIDENIPGSAYKEDLIGSITHEGYIVLSYIDEINGQFRLNDLNPAQFNDTYILAIERLKLFILSNDEMYELIEKNKDENI